jgi:hypothetical protein
LRRTDDGAVKRRLVLVAAVLALGGLVALDVAMRSFSPVDHAANDRPRAPDEFASFDVHGFKLAHPIAWSEYTYGSICLVEGCPRWALAEPAISAACKASDDDLNCVGQLPLEPGAVRVEISQRSVDAGGLQRLVGRRSAGESVTDTTVAGMPALEIDEHDQSVLAFLHTDLRITWIVRNPDGGPPPQAIVIVAIVRGPGVERRIAQLRELIARFAFAGASEQHPVASIPDSSSMP